MDKSIAFQLVRGLSWTSRAIGYFGAGYYSHIDAVTPQGYLRGARADVITPRGGRPIPAGFQDRPQHYERWARATRYTITVSEKQYRRYWDFSDAQLGKPYDKHGLFDTFILGRDWRDDGQWWCSEEVARNLEVALIIDLPAELHSVNPGDCAFIFAGLKAFRQEMPT